MPLQNDRRPAAMISAKEDLCMRRAFQVVGLSLIVVALYMLQAGDALAARPTHGKPGWQEIVVFLPMYQETYRKPVVAAGDKPKAYSQTVNYTWIGNRAEE